MTTRRTLRTVLATAALPFLVAGLAACSSAGPDSASGGSSSSSSDSVEKQARDWDAAFVRCMKDAGFESEGPFETGSVDADPARFTAVDTCYADTSQDRGDRPVTDSEKEQEAANQKEYDRVLECLEEKGVDIPETGAGIVAPPKDVPADIIAACDAEEFYGGPGTSK